MTERQQTTKAHPAAMPKWAFVVLLAVVALPLAWPGRAMQPTAGLDPSWILGLTIAGDAGLHLGEDLVFTFGPLGPMTRPVVMGTWAWVLGNVLRWAAMAAVTALVAGHAVRLLGRAGGAVATLVLLPLLLVPFERGADPELLVTLHVLLLLWVARGGRGGSARAWLPALPLATGTLLFLAKVSAGFTGLGLWAGWVVASAVLERRWRRLAWLGALPVVVVAGGLATGFSLAGLAHYVGNGLGLTSGFAEGMFKSHPATWWHGLAFAAITLVVLVALGRRLVAADVEGGWWREAGLALVVLAFTFTRLKYGFTREGPGHLLPAVGAMVLLALALWPSGPLAGSGGDRLGIGASVRRSPPKPGRGAWGEPGGRAAWVVPVVGALALVMVLRGVADAWIAPSNVAEWREDLASVLGSDDSDRHAEVLALYGLDRDVEADLPPGSLHADPWDTALVWALRRSDQTTGELRWAPPPIFQSYSAYTRSLDRLNAEHLAGLGDRPAPDVVLRQPKMIDGRNPAWDPPRHLLALACNYDLDRRLEADVPEDAPAATRSFDVLVRREQPRCDALAEVTPSTSFDTRLGAWVDRPRPDCGPEGLLWLAVEPPAPGPAARLRTLAWLPPEHRIEAELLDGRVVSWRFLPAFGGEPMLLEGPRDVHWALRGSTSGIVRLRLVRSDDVLQAGDEVRFSAGCL